MINSKPILLVVCFSIISCSKTIAQGDSLAFGEFNTNEINLKECSFDKDADAVILFDEAFSDYDFAYKLITKRRIRIKILKETGVDQGNIRIPFYSRNSFESIQNIQAVTYNSSDDKYPEISSVDRKSIFTERINQYYSVIKFALPRVKVGSIIEYKYESIKENYGGLEDWEFQSAIPTLRSFYSIQMIPNIDFTYKVQKKDEYTIKINPDREKGSISFEMKNIPGLTAEPYMDAIGDYTQKVSFQFAGQYSGYGYKTSQLETWKDLADELMEGKDFGGVIKKGISANDEVKAFVAKENSSTSKIVSIYNYVRKNFTWNQFYGKLAPEGLKNVLEKKTGSAAEINLLLLCLLRSFDIEAYPLLVAERDFGKVDTTYPFFDRFNKTAVYAIGNNIVLILDATQPSCPPSLIPYSLLNTYGFVVDKKKYKLFKINSSSATYANQAKLHAVISEKGILTGNVEIGSTDYAKQLKSVEIQRDEKKFLHYAFEEPYEGLQITNFYCDNLTNEENTLIQHADFKKELNESGGFVLFNYNLFTGLGKSPFTKSNRFTNVDFGFPIMTTVEEEIELPVNSKVDNLPENKTLKSPSQDIIITRKIENEGNLLKIQISFVQTATLIYPEQYENLRQFYRSMVDMLNEPVVIKLQK